MSQKPLVSLGTKLDFTHNDGIETKRVQGTVIAIRRGSVDILGESGVQTLTFTTVEKEVLSNG